MNNKLIKGFSVLALSNILVKIIGGLYRIPLASMLSAEGIGIYQMVFPLYSLLLMLSSSALPSTIAYYISTTGTYDKGAVLATSWRMLLVGGVLFTVLMAVFSSALANFQGYGELRYMYIALSPSVLIVALISYYRGVNQGMQNMNVTAISQLIEQLVKLSFGILLVYIFRNNLLFAVFMAVFSITISELLALLYVKRQSDRSYGKMFLKGTRVNKDTLKNISVMALPMSLSFCILPIVQLLESKLIVEKVVSTIGSLADYGLYSGCALTIVGIPISLVSALGIALIPTISSKCGRKCSEFHMSLRVILVFMLACSIGLWLMSDKIVDILYKNFSVAEHNSLVNILKYSGLCLIAYGVQIVTSSTLYGLGKNRLPLVSIFIGGVLKMVVLYAAVGQFGIISAPISNIVMYSVASVVNLVYINSVEKIIFPRGFAFSVAVFGICCYSVVQLASLIDGGVLSICLAVLSVSIIMALVAVCGDLLYTNEKLFLFDRMFFNKGKVHREN